MRQCLGGGILEMLRRVQKRAVQYDSDMGSRCTLTGYTHSGVSDTASRYPAVMVVEATLLGSRQDASLCCYFVSHKMV